MVQGDMASEEDRRWRRFFLGKVSPITQNPESLLYSYLTVPRFNAPRWWNEGGAVFLETWMNGGLGRAQGGYDEMVFRAHGARRRALLRPAGARVARASASTSRSGRTHTSTARASSPGSHTSIRRKRSSPGSGATKVVERNYADQFQQVFGLPLEQAWQDWIAFEHEFQRRNLGGRAQDSRLRRNATWSRRAIGSISRMYFDETTGTLYGAFRMPGVVDHVGALNTRDGSLRRLADIKRAMLVPGRVDRLRPRQRHGCSSPTTTFRFRDLMAVDVRTGEERMLIKDARIGEIVFNPVDRSLLGVRHWSGVATLVRIPYPYTEWVDVHTFP